MQKPESRRVTNDPLADARSGGRARPWIWVGASLLILAALNASLGPVAIPASDIAAILLEKVSFLGINPALPDTWRTIVLQIRLPHTLLIILTGMALGGSGAAYQGLFRNPLADPYIIGVASGAGLGAVVAMALGGETTILGLAPVPAAAFLGAAATVALVYSIARIRRATPTTTLILAGVAVGTFASALTSLVLLVSSDELRRAVVWLLGGFSLGGWEPVLVSLPYMALGLSVLLMLGRPLNVMQFGDEQASQLGLNVERVKLVVVTTASLLAATAVSFSGIVGFVGLIVPHAVRSLWGEDYRRLLPLATLSGAVVLLAADILSRTVMAPRELPVGIITALLGAPFFIWLLRRARMESSW